MELDEAHSFGRREKVGGEGGEDRFMVLGY